MADNLQVSAKISEEKQKLEMIKIRKKNNKMEFIKLLKL